MSNIIPPYINDRFNTLNAYIKNLYKAFVEFSANFSVDLSGNINLNTTNNINLDANNNINLNTTNDINLDASGNINVTGNIVGAPLNLTSTSDVNISGTSINIVSSSASEIYINDISGTQLFKIKYGNGPPTAFETGINNGSLYIDYQSGYMYIYRAGNWSVM